MPELTKKQLKDAFKNEMAPLLIGIRNDLKQFIAKFQDSQSIPMRMEFTADAIKEMKHHDGKTPVKGKDYFTEADIKFLLKLATPVRGKHYFTKEDIKAFRKLITPVKGKDYVDGEKPVKGKDYFTDKDIKEFLKAATPVKGVDYKDGAKGEKGDRGPAGTASISPDLVRDLLEKLTGKARLKISAIADLDERLNAMSAGGGSSMGGSGGDTVVNNNVVDAKFTEGVAYDTMFQKVPDTMITVNDSTLLTVGGNIGIPLLFIDTINLPNLTDVTQQFNISGSSLATLNVPKLVHVGFGLTITNTNISTLDLSKLVQANSGVTINSNLNLNSINLDLFNDVSGPISFNGNAVVDISMPALVHAHGITVVESHLTSLDLSALVDSTNDLTFSSNANLASVNLSSLETVTGSLDLSNCNITGAMDLSNLVSTTQNFSLSGNPLMTSLDLSSLETVGNEFELNGIGVSTLDLSALTSVQNLNLLIEVCPNLVSVDLSNLINVGNSGAGVVTISANPMLTTILLNSALQIHSSPANYDFSGNALTEDVVNNILLAIDTAGQSAGTLNLSGGTNASPTGGGANANFLSLQGKGWSVATN